MLFLNISLRHKEATTLKIQLLPLTGALGVIVDVLLQINSILRTALALMEPG